MEPSLLSRAPSPSKVLITVLCCAAPLALAVATWIAFGKPGSEDAVQRIVLGLGIALVTVLVATQAFEACAVALDDIGIEQIRLVANNRLFVKQRLLWRDVEQTSTDQNAFVLRGAGLEIRVRLMVFSKPQSVVAYMKARLPSGTTNDAAAQSKS